jgi:cysteine-rich repeat protein
MQLPFCGNGIVEANEACDDGNNSNTDTCLANCQLAECGDGFVRTGAEECEPPGTDGCGSDCVLCDPGYTGADCGLPRFAVITPNGEEGRPNEANGDGSVVVGETGSRCFRWALGGSFQRLSSDHAAETSCAANDVSLDGSVVVGTYTLTDTSRHQHAWRWTANQGMVALADSGTTPYETARGVSGDGSTVVGYSARSDDRAFVWTANAGMVALSALDNYSPYSTAFDISRDGSAIVGASYTAADYFVGVRWTKPASLWPIQELGTPSGIHLSEAVSSAADGGTTLMNVGGISTGHHPHLWTPTDGFSPLQPSLTTDSWVNDMSEDGSVVVGESAEGAWVWTEDSGHIVMLRPLLAALGVDLRRWSLTAATAISDDGNVIVGTGRIAGTTQRAWLARWR